MEYNAQAQTELLREFYRSKGIDIDQPKVKTIRRVSLEEKNRQHEEWHREFELFLRERK